MFVYIMKNYIIKYVNYSASSSEASKKQVQDKYDQIEEI